MHHYPFNIGDYRKDTGHLTVLEHGVYRMLIDSYYANEGPLKADDDHLMRTHSIRMPEEQEAYKNVIRDFFKLENGHYLHEGCEKVLAKIYAKSEAARASAEARWGKKNKDLQKKNANAMRTQCEPDADDMLPNTHNPIPITHNPDNKYLGDLDFSKWPDRPTEQVWRDYKKHRQAKKAPITQTVISRMAGELSQAAEQGFSVDDCLAEAMEAGWSGFKFDWFLKRRTGNANGNSNSGKQSTVDRQRELADKRQRARESGQSGEGTADGPVVATYG